MEAVPVLCQVRRRVIGVQRLLNAVVGLCRSLDGGGVDGTDVRTGAAVAPMPSMEEPFCGLAFKITDPYVETWRTYAYIRGIWCQNYVYNVRTGKKERISRLYQMHSSKQNPIEVCETGDICAAVGFKDLRTGDTICSGGCAGSTGGYGVPRRSR